MVIWFPDYPNEGRTQMAIKKVGTSDAHQNKTPIQGLREGSPDKTRETKKKQDQLASGGSREGSPDKTRGAEAKARKAPQGYRGA